jgi:hypothetical protein
LCTDQGQLWVHLIVRRVQGEVRQRLGAHLHDSPTGTLDFTQRPEHFGILAQCKVDGFGERHLTAELTDPDARPKF